jgi:hypothetical protein
MKLAISLFLVAVIAISISRRIRLSARYERQPRELNTWSALDQGIDPTEEQK